MRFARNLIVGNGATNGVGFEMSFGPALLDNNVIIGGGGGTGVTGMDASAVTMVHNLVANFSGGGAAAQGVQVFSLTGRSGGKDPPTCALRNWIVAATLLLGTSATAAPWARLHMAKNSSHGQGPLVTNDTLRHNLVRGAPPTFGNSGTVNGPQPTGVVVANNTNVTAGFTVALDAAGEVLALFPDGTVGESGCVAGGPGGEVDFAGIPHSPSAPCVPGPLAAGKPVGIPMMPPPEV